MLTARAHWQGIDPRVGWCVLVSAILVEWLVVRPGRLDLVYQVGLPGHVVSWIAAGVAVALVIGTTIALDRMSLELVNTRNGILWRRRETGWRATSAATLELLAARARWWWASTIVAAGTVVRHRGWYAGPMGVVVAAWWLQAHPFPWTHPVMMDLAYARPDLVQQWAVTYAGMVVITAVGVSRAVLAAVFIWGDWTYVPVREGDLPSYPAIAERNELCVVVGEQHHALKREPAASPRWVTIPERGLYTGIAIFGATGSGKTSGCMYLYTEQLLGTFARDRQRRAGALVLEVKGDFCFKVKKLLRAHGRLEDYVELRIGGAYRYNPLNNNVDPYSLAYCISETVVALFGRSNDSFWAQATTDLGRFVITLHRALFDYVTLRDIYSCAIDEEYFGSLIADACRKYGVTRAQAAQTQSGRLEPKDARIDDNNALILSLDTYIKHQLVLSRAGVRGHPGGAGHVYVEARDETIAVLDRYQIPYERRTGLVRGVAAIRRHEVAAVANWFDSHWTTLHARLKSTIVQNLTVFLAVFEVDPEVQWTFCPPPDLYQKEGRRRGIFESLELGKGTALPALRELIEDGKVVCLNMPAGVTPGLARVIGTMLKLDYQRAVLQRIAAMARAPERYWRPTLFLCDEYQEFATVGEGSGDDRFFALSRQGKCMPVVATQSVSSVSTVLDRDRWRPLMQQFRTKLFFTLTDEFTAKYASELCGRADQLFPSYGLSEATPDAKVSWSSGQAFGETATVSTSTSYAVRREPVFEPKTLQELRNGEAVALVYDGLTPQPPSLLYTKPYWLNPNVTYFAHLRAGRL